MPGYYSRPMTGQMPLTPPDSGSGYGYSTIHYPQHDSYPSHQSIGQPRHDGAFPYSQAYMRPAVAPAPRTYQYQSTDYSSTNNLPPIQTYYEPIGAPILPPLRINDRGSFVDEYQHRLQQEQQKVAPHKHQRQDRNPSKDEKATGGVSAKLDYDMERMTDFVTEAVQSMYAFHVSPICLADIDVTRSFQHHMQSSPSFRKWVHQVLSATRLPSATILLSLHYLNDRVANFPDSVVAGENQIYRLLAVALILGSKFLDDNTFINRSWSDVTGIKVAELNLLEMKWLHLINYELHIDPKVSNGLQAWIDAWRKYDAEYTARQTPVHPSPLNTNFHPQSSPRDRPVYSTPYTSALRSMPSQYSNTPYSHSDPWAPAEPTRLEEYYKNQQRHPTMSDLHDANRRTSGERARQSAYNYPTSAHPSYYPTPTYGSAWDPHSWSGAHRYDCNCSSCTYQQHYRPYMMPSSYAAQTVMG